MSSQVIKVGVVLIHHRWPDVALNDIPQFGTDVEALRYMNTYNNAKRGRSPFLLFLFCIELS